MTKFFGPVSTFGVKLGASIQYDKVHKQGITAGSKTNARHDIWGKNDKVSGKPGVFYSFWSTDASRRSGAGRMLASGRRFRQRGWGRSRRTALATEGTQSSGVVGTENAKVGEVWYFALPVPYNTSSQAIEITEVALKRVPAGIEVLEYGAYHLEDAGELPLLADDGGPHTLRAIDGEDETIAELEMIVGFDDDLAGEATRVANRLHGLLTQIHPSLERVLGPRLQHPAVLTLLERFGSPAQIRKAGRRQLVTLLRPRAPRMAERLIEEIFAALDEQTVTVPGTEAAALIVPSLAGSLTAVLDQRKLLAGRIEELLEDHPLSKVLTSMPGVGVRTGARILIEVGDGSTFPTAGHLAAYAGLAPATRNSGSSIRGEQPSRRGNKQLKRAFFLSAFAALGDPASRAYYDKKIAQGKHHTQALLCLARRRADVLFAMLRDGTFYEPQPAAAR